MVDREVQNLVEISVVGTMGLDRSVKLRAARSAFELEPERVAVDRAQNERDVDRRA
jgi:hypothetical protein